MQQTEILHLLEKYKDGTITEEERVLLESWYAQWEPEATEIDPKELEKLEAAVWGKVKPARAKVIPWKPLVAASIIIIIIGLALYEMPSSHTPASMPVTPVATLSHDIKPGAHRAILTLSDKRQIVLKDSSNGWIGEDADAAIYCNTNGDLSYQSRATAFEKYNTLSTPRAGHYQVTLADGTKVWLNAASSITYPLTFNKEERQVRVTGEVYFEVAHRDHHPFKVISNDQEVTVLGTHFNVRAYDDEPGTTTTLVSGSVKVSNINKDAAVLKPGQQSKNSNNRIDIRNVNAQNAISWKNGYFLFDNQELAIVMQNISRWYDVDVEYREALGKERFGGTFSRSSNLRRMLQNMEKIGHVHFELNGNKIIVSKKR